MRRVLLACVILAACANEPSVTPAAPAVAAAEAGPAEFSFEEEAAMLAPREILLEPLHEQAGLLTAREFDELLQARMSHHPNWGVLVVHLATVDIPNPMFERFDLPMYVVEITGPETGNCFDLYDATDGSYDLGACFYPTRG